MTHSRIIKTLIWLGVVAACWIIVIRFKSSTPPVQAVPPAQTTGQKTQEAKGGTYGTPREVGRLKNRSIDESSGLAASRANPGIYWTHNDSGNGPFIYAFDLRGTSKGVWRIPSADARDWEDMEVGPGPIPNKSYLYIGDIGDNNGLRSGVVIYRLPEPVLTPDDALSTKAKPRLTEIPEKIRLRYPDGSHDAEALLVHPQTGDLYIVTKVLLGGPGVYWAPAPLNVTTTTTLTRLGSLKLPGLFGGFVTGGSISPDGSRVALCDYLQGYELVLPPEAKSFDEIWKQSVTKIDLGRREQGETIAYRLDGKALLATSEGRSSPIIQVVRR